MDDRKSWVNISKVEIEKAILHVLRWQIDALLTEWVRAPPKPGRRPDPSHWQSPGNVSDETVFENINPTIRRLHYGDQSADDREGAIH